jgi:hypothetical protein
MMDAQKELSSALETLTDSHRNVVPRWSAPIKGWRIHWKLGQTADVSKNPQGAWDLDEGPPLVTLVTRSGTRHPAPQVRVSGIGMYSVPERVRREIGHPARTKLVAFF